MQRRRLLSVVGTATTAGLAGCMGIGGAGNGTGTGTPTETFGPCTVDRETPVDVENDEIDLRELPDRPDEWTESSVETYVREYESAYRMHRLYSAELRSYGHTEATQEISETDRGWRVELETNYYYNEETEEGTVHADSPYYEVVYLVAEDRLLRAADQQYASLEDAETMECW